MSENQNSRGRALFENPQASQPSYFSAGDQADLPAGSLQCTTAMAHLVTLGVLCIFHLESSFSSDGWGLREWNNGPLQQIFFRDILTFSSCHAPKKGERNSSGLVGLISPLQRGSYSERSILWKNERRMTCALFTTRLSTTAPCADKAGYCRKMDFSAEELW